MTRKQIARAANAAFGTPELSATSRSSTLHRWLEAHVDDWDRDYEDGYTLDELWTEVASVVESTEAPTRVQARSRFDIPGWSVGYSDEIGAHAATRSPGRDLLFVMTSDDREPRSFDEEVTVGLYQFDGDEWEQIGYEDFKSVVTVTGLSCRHF